MDNSVGPKRPTRCVNCSYWTPQADQSDVKEELGECYRYPPQVAIVEDKAHTYRPITTWRDFCGEFKTKHDA